MYQKNLAVFGAVKRSLLNLARQQRLLAFSLTALVVFLATVARTGAETFQVLEDTYSASGVITKAAGTAATLLVGPKNDAFIKFGVTNAGLTAAQVTSARLTLYFPAVTAAGTLNIFANSSDFSEILTKSATAPTQDTTNLGTVSATTSDKQNFVVIDVTEQVQAWLAGSMPDFGFAITTTNGAKLTIGAKEGPATGYPAVLEVDASPSSIVGTNADLTGTFSGNGIGLTNLNASQLGGGTVPLAQLPTGLVTNTETGVTLGGIITASTATNSATAVLASNVVSSLAITNAFLTNATITNSTFAGNGGGLTNLNVAQLGGPIAITQLPAAAVTNTETGVTLAGQITASIATNAGTAALASNVVSSLAITNAFLTNATITNSTFAGNGGGLTNLNVAQLSGPIATAQLPAAAVTNTETGVTLAGQITASTATNAGTAALASNVVSGLTLTNAFLTNATITNSTFAGNGGGLTNLNVAQLSGPIAIAQLPAAAVTNTETGVTLAGQITASIATNAGTAILASNVVSGLTLTNAFLTNATITNSTFAGNGGGLTNLNVAQLSGPIAIAQLPAAAVTNTETGVTLAGHITASTATNAGTAALASNVVSGLTLTNAFLTNAVITNSTFAGNGSGLTNLNVAQLSAPISVAQLPAAAVTNTETGVTLAGEITASTATNAGTAVLASNVVSGLALTNAFLTNAVITNSTFAGDGGGLTNLNASQLDNGTIPLAQLPAAVLTNGASEVDISGLFSGDGAGLTNVPGAIPVQVEAGTSITASPNQEYLLTNNSQSTLTLPSSANVGDIVTVVGGGSNGFQVSSASGQSIAGAIFGPGGVTWTETSAPEESWSSVASSSDGTHLVALAYGVGIYTSPDSGVTWTQTSAPAEDWSSVASSSDGSHLVAVVVGGGIYTSPDSGVTWTLTSAPIGNQWTSVASSSDGTHLVAAFDFDINFATGPVYASTDSGATWTPTSIPSGYNWYSVASSSDGSKLVAVSLGGEIYTSADSGATWTATSAPSEGWNFVASSSDGSHLVALAGNIYSSPDSGVTWTATSAPNEQWNSVASSADGTHLVAVADFDENNNPGPIYSSTNSGVTWTATSAPVEHWYSVASSSDGSKLVAVNSEGGQSIYTSDPEPLPFTGFAGTSAQFQYVGNGVWQPAGESASQISGGTLSPAVLPSVVVTNTSAGVTLSGSFSGDGSGLTNLQTETITGNQTVALALSTYFFPWFGGTDSTTESAEEYNINQGGILTNFMVTCNGLAAGTNVVWTVLTNGVPTSITCTVHGAGGGATFAVDTTDSVSATNYTIVSLRAATANANVASQTWAWRFNIVH